MANSTAPDPNAALGQSNSAYTACSGYFSSASTAAQSGGNFPEISDLLSSLDYSELHKVAALGQSASANSSYGAVIDTVHHIVGVQREAALIAKAKSAYYTDAQSESQQESDYYASQKSGMAGMMNGIVQNP